MIVRDGKVLNFSMMEVVVAMANFAKSRGADLPDDKDMVIDGGYVVAGHGNQAVSVMVSFAPKGKKGVDPKPFPSNIDS